MLYPVSQSQLHISVVTLPSRRQRERGRWTWAARRGRRGARARAALHTCGQQSAQCIMWCFVVLCWTQSSAHSLAETTSTW